MNNSARFLSTVSQLMVRRIWKGNISLFAGGFHHLQDNRTIIYDIRKETYTSSSPPTSAEAMTNVTSSSHLHASGSQGLDQRAPNNTLSDSVCDTVFYDLVLAEEIDIVHNIEVQGFPAEEVDTIEMLRFHQRVAPELFLGAFVPLSEGHRRLIAYIFATLSSIPRYTHESMSSHIPNSAIVCSHTLCVDREFRGASIGLKLFTEFTNMCRRRGIYDRMVFIAKGNMLPVYERLGFKTVGLAEVTLGKDVWYEMCIKFRD